MPIKVSELFYSVQGEGRYMGVQHIERLILINR
jgi:organic radical activating enzyme